MAFREGYIVRAEARMADALLCDAKGEHTLAELLAPGFFPGSERMAKGTLLLLFGSDGAAWAYVKGHDGTAAMRPVIELVQGGVSLATAPAPDPQPESLKLTRKAA